jgi:FkbM family methyltransferase
VRAVRPGDVVYDLGANVGYYSLAAARRVGPHGRVIAFEPLPDVADVLERHLAVNGIRNVTVERCAVSDEDGEAWFDPGVGSAYGRLSETGRIRVPTVSLDRFCAVRGLPLPNVVKIDVEGAELQALRGAVGILRRARPRVMLSLHTAEMQRECPALLASLGYEFVAVDPWKGMGADSGTFLAEPAPR